MTHADFVVVGEIRRVGKVALAGVHVLIDVPEQRRIDVQRDRQIVPADLGREQGVLSPRVRGILIAAQSPSPAAGEGVVGVDGRWKVDLAAMKVAVVVDAGGEAGVLDVDLAVVINALITIAGGGVAPALDEEERLVRWNEIHRGIMISDLDPDPESDMQPFGHSGPGFGSIKKSTDSGCYLTVLHHDLVLALLWETAWVSRDV